MWSHSPSCDPDWQLLNDTNVEKVINFNDFVDNVIDKISCWTIVIALRMKKIVLIAMKRCTVRSFLIHSRRIPGSARLGQNEFINSCSLKNFPVQRLRLTLNWTVSQSYQSHVLRDDITHLFSHVIARIGMSLVRGGILHQGSKILHRL